MKVRGISSRGAMIASLALLGAGLAVGPAGAQSMQNDGHVSMDPTFAAADMDTPRHEFRLYSQNDKEVVKYKKVHTLSLCIGGPDKKEVYGTRHAYAVIASYAGKTTTVQPGKCGTFRASEVTIRPARPISPNDDITGKITIVK